MNQNPYLINNTLDKRIKSPLSSNKKQTKHYISEKSKNVNSKNYSNNNININITNTNYINNTPLYTYQKNYSNQNVIVNNIYSNNQNLVNNKNANSNLFSMSQNSNRNNEEKIDFNELDQFSPPFQQGTKINVNDSNQKIQPQINKYTNIEIERGNQNKTNNNGKQIIDDFLQKMKYKNNYNY